MFVTILSERGRRGPGWHVPRPGGDVLYTDCTVNTPTGLSGRSQGRMLSFREPVATPRGTGPPAGSVCLGAARSAVRTPDYEDLDRGPYLPRMGAPTLSQPFSPCKVLGSVPRESAQYIRYRPLLSEGTGQGLPGGPDAAPAEGGRDVAGRAGRGRGRASRRGWCLRRGWAEA